MKKRQVFLATVLVCCVFLGIGFYAGYATHAYLCASSSALYQQ